jgi:hypothetical protein
MTRAIDALPGSHPKRGAIAVGIFLAIGLSNVLLLLRWGGTWALAVVPPVLFVGVLVWVVFATDFLDGRP